MGFCISLGEKFFAEGIVDVDDTIVSMLKESAGANISSRVIPAYAILYWFASKVYIKFYTVKDKLCEIYVTISGAD